MCFNAQQGVMRQFSAWGVIDASVGKADTGEIQYTYEVTTRAGTSRFLGFTLLTLLVEALPDLHAIFPTNITCPACLASREEDGTAGLQG